MKFATTTTPLVLTILLALNPSALGQWVAAFYQTGTDCGSTSDNYVVYSGTDSSCHQIGSDDDSCEGFTDGGASSDQSLCISGDVFLPSSIDLSPGSCNAWSNLDCSGIETILNPGC